MSERGGGVGWADVILCVCPFRLRGSSAPGGALGSVASAASIFVRARSDGQGGAGAEGRWPCEFDAARGADARLGRAVRAARRTLVCVECVIVCAGAHWSQVAF